MSVTAITAQLQTSSFIGACASSPVQQPNSLSALFSEAASSVAASSSEALSSSSALDIAVMKFEVNGGDLSRLSPGDREILRSKGGQVKKLTVINFVLSFTKKSLELAGKLFPRLSSLHIQWTDDLSELPSSMTHLQEFTLSNARSLSSEAINAFLIANKETLESVDIVVSKLNTFPFLSHLRKVKLNECPYMTDESLTPLLKCNPRPVLDVRHTQVTPQFLKLFSAQTNETAGSATATS